MKKQKQPPDDVNNSITEVRPELFNFFENRGKSVSLILKNDNVRTGYLLCCGTDGTVVLNVRTPQGRTCISETPVFEISEIIVLDDTSSIEILNKN